MRTICKAALSWIPTEMSPLRGMAHVAIGKADALKGGPNA